MKTLLIALNAKYTHSSLAIRSLQAYCKAYGKSIDILELTINQPLNDIIKKIYEFHPDMIGFSCYIWNIELICNIIKTLKKIMPDTAIILGGPEVSFHIENILKDYQVDFIISGPGEKSLFNLLNAYENNLSFKDISGLSFLQDGSVTAVPVGKYAALEDIPFVYSRENIDNFKNRIIYYETSRGCPFSCSYCLSSVPAASGGNHLEYLSLPRVFSDLQFFLSQNLRQVKLVDRTFNSNPKRARDIWGFLIAHDNGVTNFHFEISADLLNDDCIFMLKKARPGLFQFEIGVQSFYHPSLKAINRKCDLNKLSSMVQKIHESNNIHQHLDLIAGLPLENYDNFGISFNHVYALRPQQLQLGFLKVLKGSTMEDDAKQYGIVYMDTAPYEVLQTGVLNYSEILRLKSIEEMVEIFYNSLQFANTLTYYLPHFPSPFAFYEALSVYWEENNYHEGSHKFVTLYKILCDFLMFALPEQDISILHDFLKLDMLLQDKVWLPEWIAAYATEEERKRAGQATRGIKEKYRYEKFYWDVTGWKESGELKAKEHFLVFIYDTPEPFHGKIKGRYEKLKIELNKKGAFQ